MADAEATVRSFYAALDAGDYDALESLLAPAFVQRRPDRSFEGRAAFVSFMRDGRPATDTEHVLEAVYEATADDRVAAEGRLLAHDGTVEVPEPLRPYMGGTERIEGGEKVGESAVGDG